MHGRTFLETNSPNFVIIPILLKIFKLKRVICCSQLNFSSMNNLLYYVYSFFLISSSLVLKFILSVFLFLLRLNIKTSDSSILDVSLLASSQFTLFLN